MTAQQFVADVTQKARSIVVARCAKRHVTRMRCGRRSRFGVITPKALPLSSLLLRLVFTSL